MSARRGPTRADLVLALACAAGATIETLNGNHNEGSLPVYVVVGLAQTLPLMWRRRAPFPMLMGIVAVTALEGVITTPSGGIGTFFGLLIGCYSVAAYAPLRFAVVGLAVQLPLLVFDNWRSGKAPYEDLGFAFGLIAGFWIVGRIVRSRELLADQLAVQAEELRRSRAVAARLAAAEERARIAREMHDVLAHNLSLMVVQAETGLAVLPDPEHAAVALRRVAEAGRSALADLRSLLGALRTDDDDVPVSPRATLARADDLVASLREAGFDVELRVVGEPSDLPAAVDLAGYRVLQEALTNVARHCGPTKVRALVQYGPHDVRIDVVDDGPAGKSSGRASGGAGQGLAGLRERVAALGGEFEARPCGGGFQLQARIPVPIP